ncbi:MAG: hypothetical protein H6828_07620 [Planctomycetes bacterium]|nr:hypothetical protein [Planctomycetota bacterium]
MRDGRGVPRLARAGRRRPTRAPRAWTRACSGAPVGAWRERLHNDLEAPALAVAPELAAWRALLERCGEGHARLTGSGSSFFALHADEASACAALERVRAAAAEAGLDTRLACVTRPRGPE